MRRPNENVCTVSALQTCRRQMIQSKVSCVGHEELSFYLRSVLEKLQHGWKEVQVHDFVVGHTGIQLQSNVGVLQALQVDDADSRLANLHMAQREHLLLAVAI